MKRTELLNKIKTPEKNKTQIMGDALEVYMLFDIVLYEIRNLKNNDFFYGIYSRGEAKDVQWHMVHDLGSKTLGHQIRVLGPDRFDFKIVGLFPTLSEAKLCRNLYTLMMLRKGYDRLNDGYSLSN